MKSSLEIVKGKLDLSTVIDFDIIGIKQFIIRHTEITALDFTSRLIRQTNSIIENTFASLLSVLENGYPPELESINFSNNSLGDAAINKFSEILERGLLPHIKAINLDNNCITAEGMFNLLSAIKNNNLAGIQILSLNHNNIGYEAMREFAKSGTDIGLINLTHFCLSDNIINNDALKELMHAIARFIPNLRVLELNINNIESIGVDHISKAADNNLFINLEHLDLSSNTIENTGVLFLSTSIINGSFKKLKTLLLDDDKITEQGIIYLASSVKYLPNLQKLGLSHNYVGVLGIKVLLEELIIAAPNYFNAIDLDFTNIGDEGAKLLAGFLSNNLFTKNIKSINLRKNNITDDGGIAIAKILVVSNFSSLEIIDLASNHISDKTINMLSLALPNLHNLNTIDLYNNHVTDVGAKKLADFIEKKLHSPLLKCIELSENLINPETFQNTKTFLPVSINKEDSEFKPTENLLFGDIYDQ